MPTSPDLHDAHSPPHVRCCIGSKLILSYRFLCEAFSDARPHPRQIQGLPPTSPHGVHAHRGPRTAPGVSSVRRYQPFPGPLPHSLGGWTPLCLCCERNPGRPHLMCLKCERRRRSWARRRCCCCRVRPALAIRWIKVSVILSRTRWMWSFSSRDLRVLDRNVYTPECAERERNSRRIRSRMHGGRHRASAPLRSPPSPPNH